MIPKICSGALVVCDITPMISTFIHLFYLTLFTLFTTFECACFFEDTFARGFTGLSFIFDFVADESEVEEFIASVLAFSDSTLLEEPEISQNFQKLYCSVPSFALGEV